MGQAGHVMSLNHNCTLTECLPLDDGLLHHACCILLKSSTLFSTKAYSVGAICLYPFQVKTYVDEVMTVVDLNGER